MTTRDPAAPGPRPVRVLMVVRLFHPWVGGTERQAHKLARALLDLGVDVQVVTGWWFRGTRRRERIDGVPVFRNHTLWEFFGIRGLRKFGGYLYILSLMWHLWWRRDSYDVIHVHGLNYHTFAAVLAGSRLDKPTSAKLANSGPASDIARMRNDRQLFLSRFMLPRALSCDRFVALNPAVVAELGAAGVERSRIVELPNGVETGRPLRTDYALREPPVILYVGRLHAQKGVDSLLRAFALLRGRRDPAPVLRVVGDGPAGRELAALAGDLGIASQVEFAGSQTDVLPHLLSADVFVLASRAEGLSNALLEAMACGVPPVVTDIPGNRDVVQHGHNGLVVPAGDPERLAAALGVVLEDRRLRESLGAAARRTVEDGYGLERVAARYLCLFEELERAGRVSVPAGGQAGGHP